MAGRGDDLAERIVALWDRSSPEERGRLALLLWSHAATAVLVDVGAVACLVVSGARIWQRRRIGWARATVQAGAWQGVAFLVLAAGARAALRQRILQRLRA